MDIMTVVGILLAFGMIFGPLVASGDIILFFNIPGLILVLGGSLAALMIAFTMSDMFGLFAMTKNAFFAKNINEGKIIDDMVDLGEKARREGILALEREMGRIDDTFLKKAIQLAVDGNEPEVIENVMSTEISNLEERHKVGKAIYEAFASFAPAYGMLGTVIGLVQMLKSLDDPANIGTGMAIALITTFYGSVIANVIAIPISNKLARRSKLEAQSKNMILFGVLSIHSGDNPRVTRDKLETFVAPKFRKGNG
jgi:chemotaxis protein MotA